MGQHSSHSSRDPHAGPLLDAIEAAVLGLPIAAKTGYALLTIVTIIALVHLAH